MHYFRVFLKIVGAAAAFVALVLLAGWVTILFVTRGGDVYIPETIGQSLVSSIRILQEHSLYPYLASEQYHPNAPRGYVIAQDPAAGSLRKRYTTVKLVISSGPERLIMSDLRGYGIRQARIECERMGLGTISEIMIHHDELKEGAVIAHIPGPGELNFPGNAATIIVSLGSHPPRYKMPDIVGKDVETARGLLTEHFEVETLLVQRNDLESDIVILQDPEPGIPIVPGQLIKITVTEPGQDLKTVPNVFSYRVPQGLLEKEVRITHTVLDTETVLLKKTVEPMEEIKVFIDKTGLGKVTVYLNNKLVYTEIW